MKIGIPKDGRFGDFGGKYIPETLAPAIEELEKNYLKIRNELGKYSKKLLKKDELVVFNKIDLIDKNKLNEKKKIFSKKIKKKVLTISTFDKTSIEKIKSKLIKYAS